MPTVCLITDRTIFPVRGGNSLRILGLIRGLRTLGCRVVLISAACGDVEQLRTEVDDLILIHAAIYRGGRLATFDVEPFRRVLAQSIRKIRPAVVIAEYAWLAPALSAVPTGIQRWVDCHDLLHARTARFNAHGLDPWVICSEEEELGHLEHADCYLTTQRHEAAVLKDLCPTKRVFTLLPGIELPDNFIRIHSHSSEVLMVGANHAGNHGLREFAGTPWSAVAKHHPLARLNIVGAIGVEQSYSGCVKVVGEVSDLHHYYATSALVVCPVIVGTGIKMKMLEAIRMGKAVVATRNAAEGLPVDHARAWLTCDSLADCADAVRTLLADESARTELELAAFAYGEQHLSQSRFVRDLQSLMKN